MSNPWTPGPWVVHYNSDGYAIGVKASDAEQHRKGGAGWPVRRNGISIPSSVEGQANARLIAAAPEMAELVEAMARELPPPVSTIQELIEGADKPHPLVAHARALLARIRGDAP
jgi:hypothetical protein